MAQYDDLNSRSITLVGLFSGLITYITILGCQVLYFAMDQRQDEHKTMTTEYTSSMVHLQSQRELLSMDAGEEYRESGIKMTDTDVQEKMKLHSSNPDKEPKPQAYKTIPIDQAIQAIVKEQGKTEDGKKDGSEI